MSGRTWTPEDDKLLRELHAANLPFKAIARRLNRRCKAVEDRAKRIRLPVRRATPRPLERPILGLYRRGLNDHEISRKLGCCVRTAFCTRRRHGLPAHKPRHSATRRERRRKRVAAGLYAHRGVWSLVETRWQAQHVASARAGWPPCTAAVARLLAALFDGPLTAAELAGRLGLCWGHTAVRRAAPFVIVIGKRRQRLVYDLSPEVRASRERAIQRGGAA